MMARVFEHRDIESHGLKLIVQQQGALLLKEVNYTLFMTKTAQKKSTLWAARTYISHVREYPRHPPFSKVKGHVPSFNYMFRQPEKSKLTN